ncbi:hypothetical protein PUNSTDRAFT_141591 [Punctularia strigosozonata HHB-11173 SS5]|uniref:uncharacterized protein n=1 Tax=Punctularia strigosozonata (strain HHB-11173) TaxID=741275 RepID=UPI00044175ED|nr:uncharacterized protein PUNSTDRAFT_141591 [Punctularia strigosozonata HHB-11173 SS5]EIN13089.1 hypothetical protein PUNSTDRAFT_141591 [Punctularia strigosozonata HHB-11173 SS5]
MLPIWIAAPMLASLPFSYARAVVSPNPPAPEHERKEDVSKTIGSPFSRKFLTPGSILAVAVYSVGQCLALWTRDHPTSETASYIFHTICPVPSEASPVYLDAGFYGAWLAAVASCAFRVWAFRVLGKHFTFELTVPEDHTLVTSGPYSWVRHPSYTGLLGNVIAITVCAFGEGSWIRKCGVGWSWPGLAATALWAGIWVPSMVIFPLRTVKEDEMMKERYSKQWAEWRKRVPYRLIPGVW